VVEGRRQHDVYEGEVLDTVYSVANLVTLLRLLLVPFFFAVLVAGQGDRARLAAFAIYAIAGSTDWVDGQIARRTHTVTRIGQIIDPLVDRLLLASGVVGLYVVGDLPLWIPLLLVGRDVYLLYGSWRLERHRIILPISFIGKTTTATLLLGFSSLIAAWPQVPGLGVAESTWLRGLGSEPAALGIWFVYLGILLSLVTAVRYTVDASNAVKGVDAAG
jgi:cardiolipin synthase